MANGNNDKREKKNPGTEGDVSTPCGDHEGALSREVALKEGLDFVMDGGLMVFTSDYHRKRGYCCKSGCRNCPYGFLKTSSVRGDET